jgi:hypothetical protein
LQVKGTIKRKERDKWKREKVGPEKRMKIKSESERIKMKANCKKRSNLEVKAVTERNPPYLYKYTRVAADAI